MPELPEVETTCRGLRPHMKNQIIQDVIVRNKRLRWPIEACFAQQLKGQIIHKISRRGKYLLFKMSSLWLIGHLGMSGVMRIVPTHQDPEKHDHVDIVLNNGLCLRYTDPRRFGCLLLTNQPPEQHVLLAKLGPEPLSTNFSGKHLWQSAQSRKVAVKAFIMNHHVVVGVGNIYATEALFKSGIHPQQKANEISKARYDSLANIIKETLTIAIKKGGTTLKDFKNTSGKPGYFQQQLLVYGRAGEACVNCGSTLKLTQIAQRATVYCDRCQR